MSDIEMAEVSPCCASFANLMDGGYATRQKRGLNYEGVWRIGLWNGWFVVGEELTSRDIHFCPFCGTKLKIYKEVAMK